MEGNLVLLVPMLSIPKMCHLERSTPQSRRKDLMVRERCGGYSMNQGRIANFERLVSWSPASQESVLPPRNANVHKLKYVLVCSCLSPFDSDLRYCRTSDALSDMQLVLCSQKKHTAGGQNYVRQTKRVCPPFMTTFMTSRGTLATEMPNIMVMDSCGPRKQSRP